MASGSGARAESLRNNADTHKIRPEDIKKFDLEGSKRPPGHHPGEVLHQRRSLPFGPAAIAAGFLIVGAIGYIVLCKKSQPGTKPSEVAKIAAGVSANDGRERPNK